MKMNMFKSKKLYIFLVCLFLIAWSALMKVYQLFPWGKRVDIVSNSKPVDMIDWSALKEIDSLSKANIDFASCNPNDSFVWRNPRFYQVIAVQIEGPINDTCQVRIRRLGDFATSEYRCEVPADVGVQQAGYFYSSDFEQFCGLKFEHRWLGD